MRPGRPSLTARWVAAHRATLAEVRPTIPGGHPDAERSLYRGLSSRLLVLPGTTPTGMKTRTAFFDDETVAAIAAGVDQIVIVGAGYDGRALRFGIPGVRWIELDYPSTQADKRRRLARLGADLSRITFAPIDLLTDDVGAALATAGHVADRPSLFVCEGLFAYLTFEAIVSVCRVLADRSHPDSILAANFRVAPPAGVRGGSLRGAVDRLLAAMGEQRRADFRPGDPQRLVAEGGWTVARESTSKASRLDEGSYLLAVAAMPTMSTRDDA